jgi:hypothetical protein
MPASFIKSVQNIGTGYLKLFVWIFAVKTEQSSAVVVENNLIGVIKLFISETSYKASRKKPVYLLVAQVRLWKMEFLPFGSFEDHF